MPTTNCRPSYITRCAPSAVRHIKADDGDWCPPGAGSVENANTIAHEPVPNGTTSCGFRHSLRTRSQRTIGSGVEVFAIDSIAAVMQSDWCRGGLPSVAACWPTVIGRHLACIRIHKSDTGDAVRDIGSTARALS